jgi:hypothetical protein
MNKPVGGRGHKGVGTTHIRIPLPVEDKVRKLVNDFYEGTDGDILVNKLTTLEDAIDIAKNVLSSKKSARASVSKLLGRIYGQEVEL